MAFQVGGDFFTRALARITNTPEANAEKLKQEVNLLSGPEALPEFLAAPHGDSTYRHTA